MKVVRGDVETDAERDGDVAVCLETEPFIAEGVVPLDRAAAGDARQVRNIRSGIREGCERIVIDLAADRGAAESAGDVRAEVLRDLGVVRIELRDVETVAQSATDRRLDGSLASGVYSVWSPDGRWVLVDVHLRSEAEAAVSVFEDPARVVIDLRPGGGEIPSPPVTGERVVVLEPRPGRADYPLVVTGYSRTFEANVVVRLEQEGEEIEETFTTATAWADAWGHFSTTLQEGPPGPVRLHVGEHSARDGTWEGVEVELDMSR